MEYIKTIILILAVMTVGMSLIILAAYLFDMVLHERKYSCKYCHGEKTHNVEICPPIKLKETASKTDMVDCQIVLDDFDDPAIMIFESFGRAAYFDIRYCPICGRKLK